MIRRILAAAALALALCACQSEPRLVIIHTNDTHSHFEPIRSGADAGRGGIIERAAFVDSVRNAVGGDKVLLLHAGDFSQGTSYFSELGGQLEPRMINALGYDCVTLGNHEFDNGIEDLEARLAMLTGTRVVSSNIDVSQFGLAEYVEPYVIRVCRTLRHYREGRAEDRHHRAGIRPLGQRKRRDRIAHPPA